MSKMIHILTRLKKRFYAYLKDPLLLKKWESPYSRKDKHSDQLSVFIPTHGRCAPYSYNHDTRMFVEDMYVGIMPFMIYRGEREKYPVIATPLIDREKERLIAKGISGDRHEFQLGDAMCEFIRDTSQTLFNEGVVYLEINRTTDANGVTQDFEFEPISPSNLYEIGNNYFQLISWWTAMKGGLKVQLIRIPKDKVVKIEFPKGLISRSKYNHLLKRLYLASKDIVPPFQMKSIEQNTNVGFDLKTFTRVRYLEKAILTKRFGWDQRNYSSGSNYITEYYSMVRFLRKKRVEAEIRSLITLRLNEALNSPRLNLDVFLEMQNLFSGADVEVQQRRLTDGNVKFSDILNAVKISC